MKVGIKKRIVYQLSASRVIGRQVVQTNRLKKRNDFYLFGDFKWHILISKQN
jgi:hypothetical protein